MIGGDRGCRLQLATDSASCFPPTTTCSLSLCRCARIRIHWCLDYMLPKNFCILVQHHVHKSYTEITHLSLPLATRFLGFSSVFLMVVLAACGLLTVHLGHQVVVSARRLTRQSPCPSIEANTVSRVLYRGQCNSLLWTLGRRCHPAADWPCSVLR